MHNGLTEENFLFTNNKIKAKSIWCWTCFQSVCSEGKDLNVEQSNTRRWYFEVPIVEFRFNHDISTENKNRREENSDPRLVGWAWITWGDWPVSYDFRRRPQWAIAKYLSNQEWRNRMRRPILNYVHTRYNRHRQRDDRWKMHSSSLSLFFLHYLSNQPGALILFLSANLHTPCLSGYSRFLIQFSPNNQQRRHPFDSHTFDDGAFEIDALFQTKLVHFFFGRKIDFARYSSTLENSFRYSGFVFHVWRRSKREQLTWEQPERDDHRTNAQVFRWLPKNFSWICISEIHPMEFEASENLLSSLGRRMGKRHCSHWSRFLQVK